MKKISFFILFALAVSGLPVEASSFPEIGSWYTVEEPGSIVAGTSNISLLTVKILKVEPESWCYVQSEEINLPAVSTDQVVIRERMYWLNFGLITQAWPSSPANLAYYQKKYEGGVKVIQAVGF